MRRVSEHVRAPTQSPDIMKLHSPSRFTSFYESFSDLIFATMAIFVLLMMVFLALVNAPGELEELKDELEKAEAQISEQQESIEQEKEKLQDVEKKLEEMGSAVRARGLELVVAVDISGSMRKPLRQLTETLNMISKVLPKLSPEFRIGVVAYASRQGNPLIVYPLTKIHNLEDDQGRTFEHFQKFMNGLKVRGGPAPVAQALNASIKMLSQDFEGYQALMLLGDVGPFESSTATQDIFNIDSRERAKARATLQAIKQWIQIGQRRTTISVFTAVPPEQAPGLGPFRQYWPAVRRKNAESEKFFRNVAVMSGNPENFSKNPAAMLALILTSIVNN